MKTQNLLISQPKESTHLWMAIFITIVLAAYRVSAHMLEYLRNFFELHTQVPVAEWITNALFFWLLFLLWVAYRKWRRSIMHAVELDTIVSSIGPDVLLVISRDRGIKMCNGAIKQMYGFTAEDVIGRKTDILYFDRRQDPDKREIYEDLEEKGFHVGRAKGKRRDGTTFPLEIITAVLRQATGAVILLRDITERQALEDKLTELSRNDELTGLFNRRGFFDASSQQIKVARRYNMSMFLLFADLDGFKQINDTLGHHVGDEALKAAAETFRINLRDADIIGRLGGDEFAVFGVESSDRDANMTVERLQRAIEEYRDRDDRFKLGTSIGVAHFDPDKPRSLDDLLTQADQRMYEEKQKRKAAR
jgi:diguanylate cyclase (GGDEF)-like protein/PAS domain S-box-containing protein